MKILHLEAGRFTYGGAQQVIYLIKQLNAWGIDNLLLCNKGSDFALQCEAEGIQTMQINMPGDHDLLFPIKIKRAINAFQPDLMHLHSRRGADYSGIIATKWAGIPSVLTRRVDNPEPSWIAKRKYHWPDQTVCISEGIRQVLLQQGVSESAAMTIHSAVDTEKFVPQEKIADFWFTRYKVPADRKVIGIIAQMIPRKGHRFLFNRMHEIVAAAPKTHVMVFGKGPMKQELEQQVKDLGIEEYVTFAGFCDNLPDLVPQLDLLVHPALAEGLGVSLLQAACCELPIVAFARGGIPELIIDGETGFLVEGEDEATLAQRIITLLTDEGLCHAMGKKARQYMLDKFSIEQMARKNLALYQRLIKSD